MHAVVMVCIQRRSCVVKSYKCRTFWRSVHSAAVVVLVCAQCRSCGGDLRTVLQLGMFVRPACVHGCPWLLALSLGGGQLTYADLSLSPPHILAGRLRRKMMCCRLKCPSR
eukprot:1153816-Pelagomonas_calceolata.AAC.6